MERLKFLPVAARKRLFTCKMRNIGSSIYGCRDGSFFALCYFLRQVSKPVLDYLFVNKHNSYISEKISTIYLPRKGVLDRVLTYLKEARKFSLNTKSLIFYLSGSARIPLTLLSGLQGDRSIVIARCNHLFGAGKTSYCSSKTITTSIAFG
jgi:hypothetical protein